MREIAGLIASAATAGSIIFQVGKESNRIDQLFTKAHAAEIERKETRDVIFDIHGKVTGMEKDIHYIKSSVNLKDDTSR